MFSYKKFQNIDIASCQSVQELDPVLVTRVYRNNWRNASKKNVASPSTNAAEKKKEKKRQTSAKFFVLQAHAITETRNIKTIENQLLRIKKLYELWNIRSY